MLPDGSIYKHKVDPFDLDTLLAWLGLQGPDTEYDFNSPSHCLCGRYLTDLGIIRFGHPSPQERWDFEKRYAVVFKGMPSTYGHALARARAMKAGDR